MSPLHQNLIHLLYKIGVIQFGEFQLKSGQTSPIYINLRKIISYPDILKLVAELMWEAVKHRQNDVVCGVPYTALPIATAISLMQNIPMIMRRKEKKAYGMKQSIEGEYQPHQSCLIIEDVITSGASIMETSNELALAGLRVKDVIALIDREQGGRENLSKQYQVFTIFKLSQILDYLLTSDLPNEQEKQLMKKWLKQ